MKKLIGPIILLIIITVVFLLGQSATDPADYAGVWYTANGKDTYRFLDGIIFCRSHGVSLPDGSTISGAYTYSGKKIVLYANGVEGLETERDLYLVEHQQEVLLCDNPDGKGVIYFIRAKPTK